LILLSIGGLVAFLWRELVAAEPVIDLRVFKIRTYATGVFLMTTLGFVLYGSLVLLPIMLQTLLGYSSLAAGIAMAPRGMGSLIGMPAVGMIVGRLDARAAFIAAGLDPVTATQRAYAATAGIVHRQAAMLSFVDVFRMLGVMFLCLLPLVLLMNRPGTNKH